LEHEPIFKWESMKEIGRHDLKYQDRTVPGKVFEVELASGQKVRVWRADNCQDYSCHGLTFGGTKAPGGVISPLGDHVPTILRGYFEVIADAQAKAGDVLVWRGASASDVVHSAILIDAVLTREKGYLDYATRLQTKNGIQPEADMTLGTLVEKYFGESYNAYRRKQT